MAIYLITGTPGSGKTLYAVSTVIQKLAAEKVKDKTGAEVKRRVMVDNIPSLLLEHELMAPGELAADGVSMMPTDEGDGIWNWDEWCKPGDVIVLDEVQRWWRPRGNGVKPPSMIAKLETHRHKGVDFVIITQDPKLLDQNVRRLVGRHSHVRRLFGLQRAVIYDWDSCSADVSRVKTATKTLWSYPKSAYKLYASSQLHTKQRQRVPAFIAVPILALAFGVYIVPKAYGLMTNVASGKGVNASAPAVPAGNASAMLSGQLPSTAPRPLLASSAPPPMIATAKPEPVGCIMVSDRCGCYNPQGFKVETDPEQCKASTGFGRGKPAEFPDSPSPQWPLEPGEAAALSFAFNGR